MSWWRWDTMDGLPNDAVRVRWLSLSDHSTVHLSRWRSMLSVEEIERANRFVFARDRDVFIVAHALARAMMSEATKLPTAGWRFTDGAFGKPAIAQDCGNGRLRFNISHTRDMAACAVGLDFDLGIDVEACDRRVDPAISDHYFAPEEVLAIRAASGEQQRRIFFRFWTLKEAFIKATGEGLSRPLDSFAFALDPVRITFYPGHDGTGLGEDPADWQFFQTCPRTDRILALALRRPGQQPALIDARAMRPDDVRPY